MSVSSLVSMNGRAIALTIDDDPLLKGQNSLLSKTRVNWPGTHWSLSSSVREMTEGSW